MSSKRMFLPWFMALLALLLVGGLNSRHQPSGTREMGVTGSEGGDPPLALLPARAILAHGGPHRVGGGHWAIW
jgi:hypothetical protein